MLSNNNMTKPAISLPLRDSVSPEAAIDYLMWKLKVNAAAAKEAILLGKDVPRASNPDWPLDAGAMFSNFTVGTLNLWGTHANWTTRLHAAAELLKTHMADVWCLQEVLAGPGGEDSQAHQLARELGLGSVAFRAVRTLPDGTSEGLAIVSRYAFGPITLEALAGRPESSDPNARGVLHAIVELPGHRCHMLAVHLTYDAASQCTMVLALRDAIERLTRPGDCVVVAGDFNT